MSYTIIVHPRVGPELNAMASYLEEHRSGLGIRLYDAFIKTVSYLADYGLAQQKKSGANRIITIKGFKYILVRYTAIRSTSIASFIPAVTPNADIKAKSAYAYNCPVNAGNLNRLCALQFPAFIQEMRMKIVNPIQCIN